MLRLATKNGWWLVTHPDHAHLAGDFATKWGSALFVAPQPQANVLNGIYAHDNGWAARDAQPVITKQGKPAAFSVELVGAYSAFEEIDLEAYLNVRRSAVQLIAQQDPYAAILISMHTHNLLSARADRSTIRPEQLPLLDAFLTEQETLQHTLQQQLLSEKSIPPEHLTTSAFTDNFRLLQACDNLSLLSCVDYAGEATLLWPQRLSSGAAIEIKVTPTGERTFRLSPYPFTEPHLTFKLRARFIPTQTFASHEDLQTHFNAATPEHLTITITAR
jgi:hypothetical protein